MSNKNIIAIDGPAASGKGTLARKIADTLGYAHMDTGLLYRAVALKVLDAGANPADEAAAIKAAENFAREIMASPSHNILHNIALKEERVTEAASHVAAIQSVRRILFELQRAFVVNPGPGYKGAVLDGRDIGTVICPEAPVKLFITAALETRATRRFKELQSKDITATYEAVLRDMQDRDTRDAARASSPMRAAGDAAVLDTTALDQDQVLEKALKIVRERINQNP